MTYRSLLVYVDRGLASDQRVTLAAELAERLDARLIGLSGSAPEAGLGDPFLGGAMVGETYTLLKDCAATDVETARKRFAELTDFCAARTEWRGAVGYPGDLVALAARAADLVIVGRNHEGAPFHNLDPADALLSVGRPVLVMPEGPPPRPDGGAAVIAWKDGPQAQRAVVAALPLLRRAGTVHVFALSAPSEAAAMRASVEDVAGYLHRHGVAATRTVREGDADTASERILDFARSEAADLIVAGGYGHARLRERVLGGVTRSLIARSPICLLLSH